MKSIVQLSRMSRLGQVEQPRYLSKRDDAERCVEGARALGTHGVLFQDTAQAIAAIEALLLEHAS